MFNFCVVFAGHDMVTDAGRATTRRRKFKAPSLKTKTTNNEESFENMSFSKKKTFEDFNEKKNTFSLEQTTPWNTRPLKTTIEYGPYKE